MARSTYNVKTDSLTFNVDVTGIDAILSSIEERGKLLVEKAANDIKRIAQNYIPVQTSAAKNSIFVITEDNNGFSEAKSAALSADPTVEILDGDEQVSHLHALVVVSVIYGMALEYGTLQNTNPLGIKAKNPNASRPYLTPAVYEYEEIFFKACESLFEGIGM